MSYDAAREKTGLEIFSRNIHILHCLNGEERSMTFGNYLTIPTNKTINHQQSSAKYSQKYSTLYNTIKSDAITDCNKNHAAINVVVRKRKILIYCLEIKPIRTVKNIFNDFHQKYF